MEKYEQLMSKFNMKILYFIFFFLDLSLPTFINKFIKMIFYGNPYQMKSRSEFFFPLWNQVPYKGPTEIKPDMGRASVFLFLFFPIL
jgi:hypothetical protein